MNTATGAVEQTEEAMKVMSIAELLCLTLTELLELRRTLELQLNELPQDTVEFREALLTLYNLRQVLARREINPHPPSP